MITSYLEGINRLLGEGYDDKEIYSLYGEPNVGKTTFLIGEVANFLSKGYRVVWVDTEGGFSGVWNRWFPIYKERFKVKPEEEKNFIYQRAFTVEEFARFFGYSASVDYDVKKTNVLLSGKITNKTDLEDTIYGKVGRLRGKVAVIIDSFSSPIKLQFTGSVQNFSGRADAESIMMLSLMQYMEKTSAFAILTSHSSKNPTDIYHSNPTMRGGKTMQYYSKHILYWEKPLKKIWVDFRKISAVRTPIAKDWDLFSWIKIVGNTGMIDTTEEELKSEASHEEG